MLTCGKMKSVVRVHLSNQVCLNEQKGSTAENRTDQACGHLHQVRYPDFFIGKNKIKGLSKNFFFLRIS